MEPNIKPIKIDEIKVESGEKKKIEKTDFIRIDSPNTDNESIISSNKPSYIQQYENYKKILQNLERQCI